MNTFFHKAITVFVLIVGLAIVAGCSVDGAGAPSAAEVTLGWEANTESDLGGYKVHYGTASGTYDEVIDVGNKTSYTMTGLQSGAVYYFALSAYTADGLSSELSEELEYVPAAY